MPSVEAQITSLCVICTNIAQWHAVMSTDTVVVRRGSAEVKIFKATDKYPYYRVCYYTGGKRQVQTFADLGKAKDEAELRANQLSRADGWAAQMDSRDRVIYLDAKTYVDPKTHLPHPPLRIEQAMTDGRISVDPFKNPDEQIKDIVEKLRPIIPLKTENITLEISVPAQFVAQSYTVLKSTGSLKKEDWQPNGSLKAILEIPAAARPNVIDRLGAITKGTANVKVQK